MTMPNFLIPGAAKSGTTAIYSYLVQHPEIYMSPFKEPKFFAYEGENIVYGGPGDADKNRRLVNNIDDYRALFAGASNEHKAIGEASALYLYVPKACERIKYYIPDVKMFAVLRNPVERAYSSFLHATRDGRETIKDFAEALRAEDGRRQANYAPLWFYKDMGFYYAQIKRYYETFDPEQLTIYLHEDLESNPLGVLQDIFRKLGVDHSFVPDVSRRWNVSGIPKNRMFHRLLSNDAGVLSVVSRMVPAASRVRDALRRRNLVKPPFPAELRRELIHTFREDILRLQDLIHRDLSNWLQ